MSDEYIVREEYEDQDFDHLDTGPDADNTWFTEDITASFDQFALEESGGRGGGGGGGGGLGDADDDPSTGRAINLDETIEEEIDITAHDAFEETDIVYDAPDAGDVDQELEGAHHDEENEEGEEEGDDEEEDEERDKSGGRTRSTRQSARTTRMGAIVGGAIDASVAIGQHTLDDAEDEEEENEKEDELAAGDINHSIEREGGGRRGETGEEEGEEEEEDTDEVNARIEEQKEERVDEVLSRMNLRAMQDEDDEEGEEEKNETQRTQLSASSSQPAAKKQRSTHTVAVPIKSPEQRLTDVFNKEEAFYNDSARRIHESSASFETMLVKSMLITHRNEFKPENRSQLIHATEIEQVVNIRAMLNQCSRVKHTQPVENSRESRQVVEYTVQTPHVTLAPSHPYLGYVNAIKTRFSIQLELSYNLWRCFRTAHARMSKRGYVLLRGYPDMDINAFAHRFWMNNSPDAVHWMNRVELTPFSKSETSIEEASLLPHNRYVRMDATHVSTVSGSTLPLDNGVAIGRPFDTSKLDPTIDNASIQIRLSSTYFIRASLVCGSNASTFVSGDALLSKPIVFDDKDTVIQLAHRPRQPDIVQFCFLPRPEFKQTVVGAKSAPELKADIKGIQKHLELERERNSFLPADLVRTQAIVAAHAEHSELIRKRNEDSQRFLLLLHHHHQNTSISRLSAPVNQRHQHQHPQSIFGLNAAADAAAATNPVMIPPLSELILKHAELIGTQRVNAPIPIHELFVVVQKDIAKQFRVKLAAFHSNKFSEAHRCFLDVWPQSLLWNDMDRLDIMDRVEVVRVWPKHIQTLLDQGKEKEAFQAACRYRKIDVDSSHARYLGLREGNLVHVWKTKTRNSAPTLAIVLKQRMIANLAHDTVSA